MEITEEWLLEISGWQVFKEARAMWKSGVVSVDSVGDLSTLKGTVRSGGKPLKAMLIAASKSDVKGVCSCRDSRRGILCRHVIAIGVAVANGDQSAEEEAHPSPHSSSISLGNDDSKKRENTIYKPLRIVFAANLNSALTRGSLAIRIIECDEPVVEADRRLSGWIGENGNGEFPLMASLKGEQTDAFLRLIGGHPRCFRAQKGGGEEPIRISPIPIRLPARVAKTEIDGFSRILIQSPATNSLAGKYSIGDSGLFPLAKPPGSVSAEWEKLIAGEEVKRPLAWFVAHLEDLQACCDLVDTPGESFLEHLHLISEKPEILLNLEGSLANLTAGVMCRYPVADIEIIPCAALSEEAAEAFPAVDPEKPGRFYIRNLAAERSVTDQLEEMGFRPQRGRGADSSAWVLSGEREILEFYGSDLGRLGRRWSITLGERFQNLTRNLVRISPEAEFSEDVAIRQGGGDWLTFSVRYVGNDGGEVPASQIQRLLRGGGSGSVRLPGGQKAVIDRSACADLDAVLLDCDPSQSSGGYRIRRNQADYVSGTITSHNPQAKDFAGAGVPSLSATEFAEKVGSFSPLLRDYQKEGAYWLANRLSSAGGALLADEMGLGKTIQTLALISYWRNRDSGERTQPALVVCPKSLLENWRSEAEKFAPELKTSLIKGAPSDRAKAMGSGADLFITSYGTLIQDVETNYRDRPFGIVILDEAGAIKNPKTRAAKAARSLVSEGKIALTGTPVENSVRDLWSIFEFAIPGYLGPLAQFETRYAKPLEDAEKPPPGVMGRFRRRVAPFILRRTKAEVVTELPQKIEKTVFCELTPEQESVYRSILDAAHTEIDEAKRKRGAGAAKMAMFTALLRLRQTCCDLRTLPVESMGKQLSGEAASGKLETFRGELTNLIDSGGRMLCFSQFVSVLRLLREELESQGIGYCYLDGQTENRGDVVNAFQNASANEKPIFLISLKAGGYGLNLTAANHVVLYDPWWNPAVEAQAIDRAHRIGQENVVTCSRFITRGTVEEKILQLQKRKREVIDAALDDDQPSMSGLTETDLEALLE